MVPDKLRKGIGTPVFKQGNRSDCSNYRRAGGRRFLGAVIMCHTGFVLSFPTQLLLLNEHIYDKKVAFG